MGEPEDDIETESYVLELGTPGDDVETEGVLVPTEKGRTRVTAYSPKVAEVILLKIADGATLRDIAKEPGMPTKSTIQRWIMKYPDLKQAWAAARELSASSLEDEALDMARVLKRQSDFTGTKVRAFEVAMNQFRWSAAHRDPATFGQTAQPSVVVPIQINTSLDLGDGKGGGTVEIKGASTTYEVAAKYGAEYNASRNETIEGTDYTVEQGEGGKGETRGEGRGLYSDTPNPFNLDPEPKPLAIKQRKPTGRPRKGHKSPADVKRSIANYARSARKKEKV